MVLQRGVVLSQVDHGSQAVAKAESGDLVLQMQAEEPAGDGGGEDAKKDA